MFISASKRPLAAIVTALAITLVLFFCVAQSTPPLSQASPFVMVEIDNGHGSGTVLEGGYVLTAAHVTNGSKTFTIRTDDGQVYDGKLLWQNTQYDVAIIDIGRTDKVATAALSCKDNFVGQNITIVGNPLDTRDAKSWGRVSSLASTGLENLYDGMWKKLVTLDITAAPGVSGAGVINDSGQIVGILVAGSVSDRGTFRYAYAVPASVICHLLTRS